MKNIVEELYKAALKFLVPLSLQEVYEVIAQEAMQLVDADFCSIYLYQDGFFECVYSTVPKSEIIAPRRKGFVYKAYKAGKALSITTNKLKKIHPEFRSVGIKTIGIVPLSYQRKSIGVLTLRSKKSQHFTMVRFKTLKLFGSMASLAIRKTQLYSQTKDALESRDLFISMTAHELRTPLTTLTAYAQLVNKRVSQNMLPERNWTDLLVNETARLTHIVNELLEINRIKSGEFSYNLKPILLSKCISQVATHFRANHPKHILKIHNTLGKLKGIILGDEVKIIQVLSNILNNAAKFSPENMNINLSISAEKEFYKITVTDKGKGIERKDLPNIFKRFYKGTNHNTKGMGLGLFLSKHIIEYHRGKIKIKSEINKGTSVTLKLPALLD